MLIDFNISVRASSPVRTVSSTPGYLPASMIGAQWSPDIDLYQLGLTMLQVSTGFDLAYTSAQELRAAAEQEMNSPFGRFLRKLAADDDTTRFASAESALASLRALRGAANNRRKQTI